MNETNISWDDLRLFLAVARHGGLAGAGTDTGKSAPTLGRRVLALERQLGVELFERSARGYALTSHGNDLLEHVLQMESSAQPINALTENRQAPRVKVSAGVWVTYHLCNHVPVATTTDNQQHAGMNLQFISTNQVLDITHREAVIGIRNSEPTNPNLARQPIRQVEFAVYATDKTIRLWAQVNGSTPSARWVSTQTGNEQTIEVNDPRNAMDLILAGTARAVLPSFIGDEYPELVRVSDVISELTHRQWLVTHHDDRNRPEVRRVVTWIKNVLGDASAL